VPSPPPVDLSTELEPLLDDLLGVHDRLIIALTAHLEAMRQADGAALALILADEQWIQGEMRELERRRRGLASAGTGRAAGVGAGGGAGGDLGAHRPEPKLSELARILPEPTRERCLTKCDRLRAAATEARDLNQIVETTSRLLGEHVSGIMQKVAKTLSHAGTYGRMGRVESKATVVSGLDVRH